MFYYAIKLKKKSYCERERVKRKEGSGVKVIAVL